MTRPTGDRGRSRTISDDRGLIVRDRLSSPVIAWLVVVALACNGTGAPPTTVAAADTADQVFFGLKHYLTADGVLRAELEADTAYFYQGPQRADLRRVHVVFFSPQGERTSDLRAREGTYEWRSGNMEARGNVVAVTPDGRCLTTPILRYDRGTNKISGPSEFVFDGPDRHLEGESFTSDPDFRNVATTRPRRGGLSQGTARCR